jgi:lysophospholipase
MKTKTKGLILMGTAPAAGIFAFYPSMVICFYKHFLRWGFWKKSMPPYKHAFYDYCMNNQDEADKEREFSKLVPESGFTYFQMALPFLDKQKGAYIDFEIVTEPVLVITGSEDKMVHPNIAKATAKKYKDATLTILQGSDHMYEAPKFRDKTVEAIEKWLKTNNLN